MKLSINKSRFSAMLAASVCLPFVASTSSDGTVDVDWVNEELYSYEIRYVPDFDQMRSMLPNGGRSYCAPTSGVNWMAYFANHGLPELPPGPGHWAAPYMYVPATDAIYSMGIAMLTDPYDGTYPIFKYLGLKAWASLAGDQFTVTSFYKDDDWAPTVHFMNLNIMMGAYGMPGIGWYYEIPDTNLILRDGGHSVSLVSGARDGILFQMGIRDPGSTEGDDTIQSPFTTEFYDVDHRFVNSVGWGDTRLMSRFPGYSGGGKVGYLDGFTAIHPLFVVTTHPTEQGRIVKRCVPDLYGMAVPVVQEWETPDAMSIRAMAIHPDLTSIVYVAQNPSFPSFWNLNLASGSFEPIGLSLDDPRELLISRLRDLYVLDGDDLVHTAIDVRPPREEGRVTPPSALSAMAYDDDTDELVLLAPLDQEVLRYPYHLDADPEVRSIIPAIPMAADARIAWDASRGVAWVVSTASTSLFKLTPSHIVPFMVPQEFTHPVLTQAPDQIVCSDGGRIFVSCAGMLREFEIADDQLVLADDAFFPDTEAGAHLCIVKSSTNITERHSGEEWRNVLPDQFAEPTGDCVSDLNDDGTVDVFDLLILLAAWGACPPDAFCHADFDYSSEVDVFDLLELLAAWGPCAPMGACCIWDGTCANLTASDCALHGESTWIEGEDCDTFQCAAWPTGACCVDSDCVATNTEYECSALGGRWSEGETCDYWYCPDEYCDGWGSCGQYISRVLMGDVDNTSGCDTGYADYTDLAARVIPGYVLRIIINTTNYQPDDVCGIWVDWDHDFVFDHPRDFVNSGDLSAGFWITQIGAPPDAKLGPTRMRIRLINDAPLDPCDGPEPGEVEDYTIIVEDGFSYCPAWAECDAYISRVTVGEIDNVTDCDSGYSDYTDLSTEIPLDGDLDITITIGNSAGYEHGALFIDWNQDGILGYPSEEIQLEGSPGHGPFFATIVPPPDAVPGPTRMRLRVSGDEDPPGPCGATETGEVEDYTIVVVE
jgi:hypothetical protein